MAQPSFGVFGKRINVVFALPKNNIEHELSLWSIFKPQGWKFEILNAPAIQQVNYSSTINRIARQSVRVPRQNSVGFAPLDSVEHIVKDWTARNFGTLFFDKYFGNSEIFLLGKGAQFCNLVLNRPYLFILNIRGLAGVDKKFIIIVHAHIFLVNNWAKQMKRDRIKIARESNLVLANREARQAAPSGEDLSGQSAWAVLRTASEMDGKFAKSFVLEYIYNEARTFFERNA